MLLIVLEIRFILKSAIFWDIMPCSLLKVNSCFRGTYCFHLQCWRISRARNQCESRLHAQPLSCRFLFGVFFDHEGLGNMFLRNISWIWTDTKCSILEDTSVHNYCCDNIKSYIFFSYHVYSHGFDCYKFLHIKLTCMSSAAWSNICLLSS
jgi:hypothetical protein